MKKSSELLEENMNFLEKADNEQNFSFDAEEVKGFFHIKNQSNSYYEELVEIVNELNVLRCDIWAEAGIIPNPLWGEIQTGRIRYRGCDEVFLTFQNELRVISTFNYLGESDKYSRMTVPGDFPLKLLTASTEDRRSYFQSIVEIDKSKTFQKKALIANRIQEKQEQIEILSAEVHELKKALK